MLLIFAEINPLIISALIGLGGMAMLFAGILAIASRVFSVDEDPRIDQIANQLPGANCGACGYAGCRGYAEAIIKENADLDKCGPAGQAFIETVSKLLGRDFSGADKYVAFVHCKGAPGQSSKYDYDGVKTCRASAMIFGGYTGCAYGCLGYHDCVRACKYNAIDIRDDLLPVINKEKCVGCRACVSACPRKLIEMVPYTNRDVHIVCSSLDRGRGVTDVCIYGCIGCTKCVKECPVQAISMNKGLAIIDYAKCTNCGNCVKVCPVGVIHDYRIMDALTWERKTANTSLLH